MKLTPEEKLHRKGKCQACIKSNVPQPMNNITKTINEMAGVRQFNDSHKIIFDVSSGQYKCKFCNVVFRQDTSHKAVLESVRDMVEGLQKTYEGATMYFGVSKRIRVDGYNQAIQDIIKEIDQALSELNIK